MYRLLSQWFLPLFLFALLGGGGLRAELRLPDLVPKKKKKSERIEVPESLVPAPQGRAVSVRVLPGERVQIPLEIYGRRGNRVEYRVRSNPKYGRIIETSQPRIDTGMLLYEAPTHLPGKEDLVDRFVFSAKDANGSSAPTAIVVTVENLPLELATPHEVPFGEIVAGSGAVREFTIVNTGKRVAKGELKVPQPWTVSPDQYRLHPGEALSIKVMLTPREAGEYHASVTFPELSGREVRLRALALDPVVASPTRVDLVGNPDDLVRTGSFRLENRGENEETVAITAPARFGLPKWVKLAPGEGRDVPIRVGEGDLGAIDDKVVVGKGRLAREITVHSRPVGPRLVVSSQALALGKVDAGGRASGVFTVRNQGGESGQVVVSVPALFRVEPAQFELPVGATREVRVALEADRPGEVNGELLLQAAGSRLVIPMSAEVAVATPSAAGEAKENGAGPGQEGAVASTDDAARIAKVFALSGLNPEGTGQKPAVDSVKALRLAPTEVELAWKPAKGGKHYLIEARRQIFPKGGGQPEVSWVALPEVDFIQAKGAVHAVIADIPEAASATVRIVAIAASGERLPPSPPLHFSLPPHQPFWTLRRGLAVAFGFLFLGALWVRSGWPIFGIRVRLVH